MKKSVYVTVLIHQSVVVDADSDDEAERKAAALVGNAIDAEIAKWHGNVLEGASYLEIDARDAQDASDATGHYDADGCFIKTPNA